MKKLDNIIKGSITSNTLQRRRKMSSVIEQSIKESPEEFDKLLAAINSAYTSGKFTRVWDLIAVISGNDRGFGNDWFYTAIETRRRGKE